MQGTTFFRGDGCLVRFRGKYPPEYWAETDSRWYYWTGDTHDLNEITDQQAEDEAGSRDALLVGAGQPVVKYSS